ncbi:hypothetical protein BJ508DRAFT_350203, partial [Ascobolus immersus RN42]
HQTQPIATDRDSLECAIQKTLKPPRVGRKCASAVPIPGKACTPQAQALLSGMFSCPCGVGTKASDMTAFVFGLTTGNIDTTTNLTCQSSTSKPRRKSCTITAFPGQINHQNVSRNLLRNPHITQTPAQDKNQTTTAPATRTAFGGGKLRHGWGIGDNGFGAGRKARGRHMREGSNFTTLPQVTSGFDRLWLQKLCDLSSGGRLEVSQSPRGRPASIPGNGQHCYICAASADMGGMGAAEARVWRLSVKSATGDAEPQDRSVLWEGHQTAQDNGRQYWEGNQSCISQDVFYGQRKSDSYGRRNY